MRRRKRKKSYTNADLICGMTDDQLAKALLDANDTGISIPFCRELPDCAMLLDESIIPEEKCLQCVKVWLQSPAFMGGGEQCPET